MKQDQKAYLELTLRCSPPNHVLGLFVRHNYSALKGVASEITFIPVNHRLLFLFLYLRFQTTPAYSLL